MRYSMVWPADVDGLAEGTLVHVDLQRGLELDASIQLERAHGQIAVDGRQLRAAALGLVVGEPVMADFGQGRWCAVLGGSTSLSALAYLDDGDTGWSYRLYSRALGDRPQLTRWRRAGHIPTRQLLDLAGQPPALTKAGTQRALGQAVADGLPHCLPLRSSGTSQPFDCDAPDGGRFEVDRGVLTTEPATLTVYAVHPVVEWPGAYTYEQ